MHSHVHKHTQRDTHQDTYFLHIPSVVLNRLGIDGRYAFVFLSRLIKVNESCVCVCVWGPVAAVGLGPAAFSLCISLSLSLFDWACRLLHPGSLVNMAILSSN